LDTEGAGVEADLPSTIRAVAKWYFDLVKNMFIVVALFYAAKKTDDTVVGAVAKVILAVFFLYTLSYPLEAFDALRAYSRSRRDSALLSLLLTLLGLIALYGLVAAIGSAVLEVFGALFRAHTSPR
jgi:hypothetical protein